MQGLQGSHSGDREQGNEIKDVCQNEESGGRRQEAGGRRQEAGGRRQEAGANLKSFKILLPLTNLTLIFLLLNNDNSMQVFVTKS